MLPLLLLTLFLALPSLGFAQAVCTHYASPGGTGNGLAQVTPFRIANFMSVAKPGNVLCLLDGTYQGGNALIEPPPTLHGTATQPITVRALNDGKVLLDGQGGWVVRIRANWWVVEGFNARNGSEFLLSLSGQNNVGRRIIGWDGQHGQDDSNIFKAIGKNNIWEDCAGWGNNSRKIFDGAQAGDVGGSGFRRCWGEWNDWPEGGSQPTLTYQVGYNTTNQLLENVIGTWHLTGQNSPTREGVFRAFRARNPNDNYDAGGTKILGSMFYLRPGAQYGTSTMVQAEYISNLYMEDIVSMASSTHQGVYPFYFDSGCTGGCRNNICKNCLSIHSGRRSENASGSGFTLPGFREGQGLANATGGKSAFDLLPGICRRVQNGQLTTKPLWPWPMDARIREARVLSGKAPVTVTAEIESMFGPIPAACRAETPIPPLPPTDTTPPVASITAPPEGTVLGGTVTMTAAATDIGGVGGVQFLWKVKGSPGEGTALGNEDTSAPYSTICDTSTLANGVYEISARARDVAGNTMTTTPLTVTVNNVVVPPPMVKWNCTGEMRMVDGKPMLLNLACEP